nr:MAG TPA: hypothetical protein [Caudoviricetes sp.]
MVVSDGQNKPIDITGYQFVCKVRETAENQDVIAEAECVIRDAVKGVLDVNFSSEVTSQIDTDGDYYGETNSYYYDVQQINTNGRKERIVQGKFIVSPGISFH